MTITSPVGERHDGKAGTGFTITATGGSNVIAFDIGTTHPSTVVSFLELSNCAGQVQYQNRASAISGATQLIDSCILHDHTNTAAGFGILFQSADRNKTARNCIIYGITPSSGAGFGITAIQAAGGTIENCTVRDCETGINVAVGLTQSIKNSAVFDNGTANFALAGTLTGNNNATDDSSDPGSTTSNKLSLTATDQFTDVSGGDFTLKSTSVLIDAGATLAAVPVDIIGTVRPQGLGYDVGAFEFIINVISENISLFISSNFPNNFAALFLTGCAPTPVVAPETLLSRVSDNTIQIFQDGIDTLINQLGKSVRLIYPPTIIDCPNCVNDPIGNKPANRFRPGPMRFSDGIRCPYCRGTKKTEEENSEVIQGLIQIKPRDYKRYGISVQDPGALVRVKTFITDVIKIERATHAIIDIQKQDIIKIKCRKIREPIPTGLRDSRYAITFWERV